MPSRGTSIVSVLILAVLAIPVAARPDTLVLMAGRGVQGQLVSVSRGWVEFQPSEGDVAPDRLRVAVAEVRSIQFDDAADAAESSGRTTTFEIGGGGGRAQPPEPGGATRRGDGIPPPRDRRQPGRNGGGGGRGGTPAAPHARVPPGHPP